MASEEEELPHPQGDGLESYYDLVILGTGLAQSILSCVASKHGKKVLHLENNEFYGEDYSCHNLSGHIAHYSSRFEESGSPFGSVSCSNLQESTTEFTLNAAVDEEIVAQFLDNISATKGNAKTRAQPRATSCHPACFGYAMEKVASEGESSAAHAHPAFRGYAKHNALTKARLWLKDRDFNIDTTAKVLHGSCPMVDLMVASGVSNYLEFKTFEGLYFWMDGTGGTAGANSGGHIWKVPCSRGDVFNTTMLGALEKRALMKFHQFVADWGREHCGTEVQTLNENELAVGRSLYRPQNKQQAFSGYNVEQFIDRPFEEFLDDCKISPKLQRIIVYALCCHTSPVRRGEEAPGATRASAYITRDALNDMFRHIDSIGRFGETAFLSPMYGASEVVQAFCRMSAVWGGTFILRRSVRSISVGGGVAVDEVVSPGMQEEVDGADAARAKVSESAVTVVDSEGNVVKAGAFVCTAGYWPSVPTRRCVVVSCTSVWLGTVVPLARSIIIIPPSAGTGSAVFRNEYAIHIIQTDASTNAAPEGAVVLHLSTMMNLATGSGYTDSAGSWREAAAAHSAGAVALMGSVIEHLRQSMVGALPAEEISRVVVLKPVYNLDAELPSPGCSPQTAQGPWRSGLPSNVRLTTGASDASLSMQAAADEARSIFQQLFPDKDFTLEEVAPLADEAQQLQQACALENDDEAAYLEFALSAALPKVVAPEEESTNCEPAQASAEQLPVVVSSN